MPFRHPHIMRRRIRQKRQLLRREPPHRPIGDVHRDALAPAVQSVQGRRDDGGARPVLAPQQRFDLVALQRRVQAQAAHVLEHAVDAVGAGSGQRVGEVLGAVVDGRVEPEGVAQEGAFLGAARDAALARLARLAAGSGASPSGEPS